MMLGGLHICVMTLNKILIFIKVYSGEKAFRKGRPSYKTSNHRRQARHFYRSPRNISNQFKHQNSRKFRNKRPCKFNSNCKQKHQDLNEIYRRQKNNPIRYNLSKPDPKFKNLNYPSNHVKKVNHICKNNCQSNLYAKVRSTPCKKKARNHLKRAPQMKCKTDSNQYQAYQILSKAIPAVFDAESYLIAVDNHSSCCMSNNINDFVGPLVDKRVRIKGFQGASAYSKGIGTVKWKIEDDNGIVHDIYIKDVLYVPESMQRLLSPQQWAQQSQDVYPNSRGTFAIQDKDAIELHWDQDQFKKTIK